MALTVLKVKNAEPGRHVDGRGLCLVVKPSGARTWVLRMQLKGHRRDYGLGSAHDVSLADARTAAAELRRRVRDALRFTIYNAVRSNETRLAVWTEIDLENAVWTIPGERMKAGETHVVPLSGPVVALLRKRWNERTSDTGLVFSNDGKKPISDMTMTKLLRDDGFASITVHGFRSTFTDWAAECTDYPKEVADKALAHKLANKVEAAYRRTDFFEKRRSLMKQWADYLGNRVSAADRAAAEPISARAAA